MPFAFPMASAPMSRHGGRVGGSFPPSPSLGHLAPSVSMVPLSQPGVPLTAHCPYPEEGCSPRRKAGGRTCQTHCIPLAAHQPHRTGTPCLPHCCPLPICFCLCQYFTPFPSPAPRQCRASPGFPGARPPPAQELCSLVCHEQEPPSKVASLLPTCLRKKLHISIQRCCKHLQELEVR